MPSLIGFNVHSTLTYGRAYSDVEKHRMWEFFERLQPASLLFLDNLDWAREAKRRLPKTIVVFREYRQNDGQFFKNMSAQQFYDSHIRFGEGGVVVSVMNEPTGYGEQNSPDDLERIASFMAAVMDKFGAAGVSIVGPEFGVGHPDTNRLSELEAMWQAFKRWPLHYYGSHEYGTYRGMTYTDNTHRRDVVPWRVGRFEAIANYCQTSLGYVPPMLINEFGIDSSFYADDIKTKRGWRDAGLSEEQYAHQLIDAAKGIYNKPYIKGLNIFSHGNTGRQGAGDDWKTHDVSFLSAFQRELETYSRGNTPPTPTPVPTPTPLPQPPANAQALVNILNSLNTASADIEAAKTITRQLIQEVSK